MLAQRNSYQQVNKSNNNHQCFNHDYFAQHKEVITTLENSEQANNLLSIICNITRQAHKETYCDSGMKWRKIKITSFQPQHMQPMKSSFKTCDRTVS